MFYVGIDFGSTYTIVSVYRQETESLSAKSLSEGGTPFIPSMLAVSKNQISIGKEAKAMTMMAGRKSKVRSFRAFKMMLAEDDPKKNQERGFDEIYTPYRVTHDFLENVLRKIMERENETQIDQLVVGVPEIWNNEITTVDGRTKLRDICRSFSFLKKDASGNPCVQIVSEPAAASAYFSYNFRQETETNFDGRLLLIDYGGGTLDITLTEVETRPDQNGREGMEISVLKRTGAGENEEGRVGSASILYMETLMETAIRETFPDIDLEYDTDFNRAVDQLEMQLQECTSIIKGVFDEYGTDEEDLEEDAMDEEDYLFTEIMYKGSYVEIPYRLMVHVYNETIRQIFNDKMDEVIDYMNAQQIAYMDRNDERFKIMLVGGFCNFYLVRQQVAEKFAFSSTDMRQKHVIHSQEECEKAISLGAALLASGNIRIRNTAPYSIGVHVKKGKGNSLTYGLYMNQDIEFNHVYFQREEDERDAAEREEDEKDAAAGRYVVILSVSGGIESFIIDTYGDKGVAFSVYPKPEFRERLSKAIVNKNGTVVVGFSLDSSGVLSLHIHDYDILENKISEEGRKIELTSFRELFDIHEVERVYEDE